MSEKKVLYVGYYDKLRDNNQIRSYSLAAAKKMDFVVDSIAKIGYRTEIVSPAFIIINNYPKMKEIHESIAPNIDLVLAPSWGAKNRASHVARIVRSNIWLFNYLVKNADKNTPVLVYHSYGLALPVLLSQKIKGFRLILEIEEKYSMVWPLTKFQKWKEDLLLKKGKKNCLVVSEVLAEKLGIVNPIISYGNYNGYKGPIPSKENTDIRRLIYTGSIDKIKGSAFTAIDAMNYLPDNYELLLSGPISDGDKREFEKVIEKTNQKSNRNAVKYMGVLGEKEYEQLLLSADIALNPQNEGSFGEFLFPSKILTYMSFGLPVVSTKGASIVKSKVADLITFSEKCTGADVAKAITNVRKYEPEIYLTRLNNLKVDFLTQLKKALEADE